MYINGKFHKVSRCTKCNGYHPLKLSCQEYGKALRDRRILAENTAKLQKMIAPDYLEVDDDIELIVWRGRTINLSNL